MPYLVANAEILDTNIESLATKNHDADLIPIVESDQRNIDNIRDEASDANLVDTLCREELNEDVVPMKNAQEDLGRAIVATYPDLSHFSENVIHDMQVLGLVPTVAQQTMDFLSDSWANMGQKEDFVNSDSNQQFQLVILKKKISKIK